jgi:hypothetical protein
MLFPPAGGSPTSSRERSVTIRPLPRERNFRPARGGGDADGIGQATKKPAAKNDFPAGPLTVRTSAL